MNEAEVFVVEHFADGEIFFLFINFEWVHLAILEAAKNPGDVRDMVGVFFFFAGVADAAAFVAEALFHLQPEVAGVHELDFSFPFLFLPVGQQPKVGGNAGVVEKLLRQRDNRLQPVVFDDPAADFRLATAGVTGE